MSVSDHRPVYLDLALVPLIDEVVKELQVTPESGNFQITWKVAEQVNYRLERTTDLSAEVWDALDDVEITISDGMASAIVAPVGATTYYRVVASYE